MKHYMGTFPSPAEESLCDVASFDDLLIGNRSATYVIRVKKFDLADAGILPGDMVVLDSSRKPRPGDLVLAILDGEWLLRYYQRDKAGPYLLGTSAAELRPSESLVIHSVVVSLARVYSS